MAAAMNAAFCSCRQTITSRAAVGQRVEDHVDLGARDAEDVADAVRRDAFNDPLRATHGSQKSSLGSLPMGSRSGHREAGRTAADSLMSTRGITRTVCAGGKPPWLVDNRHLSIGWSQIFYFIVTDSNNCSRYARSKGES